MNQKKVKIYLDENGIPFSDFDLKNKIISINGDYQGSINASELLVYIENIDNSVSSVANITLPSGKTYTYVMGDYAEDGINFKKLPFLGELQSENGKYDISISIFDEAYEYISIIPNSYSPTAINSITFQSISGHKYYYEYSGIYGIVTATSSTTPINLSSSSSFFSIDLSDHGFSSYTEEQAHSLFSPRYDDLINGTECGFILYLGEEQPTSLASQTFSFYVSNAPISSNARNISNPTEDIWIQIMSALSSLLKTESKLFTTDGNMTLSTAISSYGRCFFFNDTAVKSPISNGDLWHLFIIGGSSGSYEIMSMEYDSNGKTCIKFAQNSGTGTLTYILNSLENKTKAVYDENGNNIVNTYLSQSNASTIYETKVDSSGKLSEAKTYADGVGAAITATKGQANGICSLGPDSKVPSANLPSYVDDVIDSYIVGSTPFASDWLSLTAGGAPLTPESGKIYIIATVGEYLSREFRWTGSVYGEVSPSQVASVNGKTGAVTLIPSDIGTIAKTSTLTLTLASAISSLGREIAIDGTGGSYFAVVWYNSYDLKYYYRFFGTQINGVRSGSTTNGSMTLTDAFTASVADTARFIGGTAFAALVAAPSVYNIGYFTIIDSSSTTYALGNTYLLTSTGVVSQPYAKANRLKFTNLVPAITSTNGWSGSGGNLTVSNGRIISTSTGAYSLQQLYYNFNFVFGHKYAVSYDYITPDGTSVSSNRARIMLNNDATTAIELNASLVISPNVNRFSAVFTNNRADATAMGICFLQVLTSNIAGVQASVGNVVVDDLTADMSAGNEASIEFFDTVMLRNYPATNGFFAGSAYLLDLVDTCSRKSNRILATNLIYDGDMTTAVAGTRGLQNCTTAVSGGVLTVTGDGTSTSYTVSSKTVQTVNVFHKYPISVNYNIASLTGVVDFRFQAVLMNSASTILGSVTSLFAVSKLFTGTNRLSSILDLTTLTNTYPTATKIAFSILVFFSSTAYQQSTTCQISKWLACDLTDACSSGNEFILPQWDKIMSFFPNSFFPGTEDLVPQLNTVSRIAALEFNAALTEIDFAVSGNPSTNATILRYFDVIGAGTSVSPYVFTPRVDVNHALNWYVFTINTEPSASYYVNFKSKGVRQCMVSLIRGSASFTTNHYYANLLNYLGKIRWRVTYLGALTQANLSTEGVSWTITTNINGSDVYSSTTN